MTEENRMPVVDFEKDKVHQYLVDQVKTVEKDNFRRWAVYKKRIFGGRCGVFALSTLVFSIYGYTMYAVNRETFLDNFDEPTHDDDY